MPEWPVVAPEWPVVAIEVAQGLVSLLSVVPAPESLGDDAVLALSAPDALALLEIARAAATAIDAVSALAMEAVARREVEGVEAERVDFRERGLRHPGGELSGDGLAGATLAPVLHLSPRATDLLLGDVRTLVGELPETFALVRAGRLDLARARAVAQAAAAVEPGLRDRFDEVLVHPERGRRRYRTRAPDLATPALRRRAAQVAADVDPASAAQRALEARADRFVWVRSGPVAGVSSWSASLPSEDSLAMWAAVEALAGEYLRADRDRTVGQARAEALTALVLGRATVTTHVDLTVPLDDWPPVAGPAPAPATTSAPTSDDAELGSAATGSRWSGAGRADEVAAHEVPRSFLETRWQGWADTEVAVRGLRLVHSDRGAGRRTRRSGAGGGRSRIPAPPDVTPAGSPVPAPVGPPRAVVPTGWQVGVDHPRVGILLASAVTALLADPDTRLRLHGTHPDSGALVTHDPTVYRPGAALARSVRARDGHCRFPGCGVEAARCQLDHVVPFPMGPTVLDSLACLCVTHHRYKTHARWSYVLHPDGTTTWTSPLGRTYTTEPAAPTRRAA